MALESRPLGHGLEAMALMFVTRLKPKASTKRVQVAPIAAIFCMQGAMLKCDILGQFPAPVAAQNSPKMGRKSPKGYFQKSAQNLAKYFKKGFRKKLAGLTLERRALFSTSGNHLGILVVA